MKKISLLFSRCNTLEKSSAEDNNITDDEQTFSGTDETFIGEYYTNFPSIKNIVSYLGISPEL